MIFSVEAPAKINRELRVGGRRPDGYHPIFSRFVSIDLSDRIEAETADQFSFSTAGEPSPSDDTNLVVRAARALAEHLRIAPRARIHLHKRIPSGAGLGGGSSDAAATLTLLSRLWGASLAPPEVASIAAGLGSDVSFFLVGGQADVSGRGEIVQPREDIAPSEIFLLVPPFPLSTAEVYAAYDLLERDSRPVPHRLAIEESKTFFGPNDLARAVLQTNSSMETYLRAAQAFADEVAITGSGSAIALSGISPEIRQLAQRHPEAKLYGSRTLGRQEYRRKTSPTGGGATWTSRR